MRQSLMRVLRRTPVVLLALLLPACTAPAERVGSPTGSSETAQSAADAADSRDSQLGTAAATWNLAPDEVLTAETTRFTALVNRIGCGETGAVVGPDITMDGETVGVAFGTDFEPDPGVVYTCEGQSPTRVSVDLPEPLGGRTLVDAACGTERETAQGCSIDPAGDGIRFASRVELDVGHCWLAPVEFSGREWNVRFDRQIGLGGRLPGDRATWRGTGTMQLLKERRALYTDAGNGAVLRLRPKESKRVRQDYIASLPCA